MAEQKLTTEREKELTKLAIKLKKVKRLLSKLNDLKTEVEQEFKTELTTQGIDTLILDGTYKITWKEANSTSFDSSTLKKDFPEIYEKYATHKLTRRFLID